MKDGLAFIVIAALLIFGLGKALSESDAGTLWCAQEGGRRITPRGQQVICVGEDGRVLPAPADKDGVWP